MKGGAEDLQARTRCFNCQELGHFARDCPLKGSGKGTSSNKPKPTFVICRDNGKPSEHFVSFASSWVSTSGGLGHTLSVFAGVRVSGAEALVDTAAEDAVIGLYALQRLESELHRLGLTTVLVSEETPVPCAGIGGEAHICKLVDAPVGVAGVHGILRFSVLKDTDKFQTPPLLPISFLEAVGATIDLRTDMLSTADAHRTSMTRLPSGHRAVNILDFGNVPWSLPPDCMQSGRNPFSYATVSGKQNFEGGGVDSPSQAASQKPAFSTTSASSTTASSTTASSTTASSTTASSTTASSTTASSTMAVASSKGAVSKLLKDPQKLEYEAQRLLAQNDFTGKAMENLLSYLEFLRGQDGREFQASKRSNAGTIVFGLFSHGGVSGITNVTQEMPNMVRYVNAWFRSKFPGGGDAKWTSFCVNVNMASGPRKDKHNAKDSMNYTATFGKFQGGNLWLGLPEGENPTEQCELRWKMRQGRKVPGKIVDAYHKPVKYSPKQVHASMAWTGTRISVTMYSCGQPERMIGDIAHLLQELMFPGVVAVHMLAVEDAEFCAEATEQCEQDLERVFDVQQGRMTSRPSAARMLKQMLTRAAVWVLNSNSRSPPASSARHGEPHGSGAGHGGPGGGGRHHYEATRSTPVKKLEAAWKRMVTVMIHILITARKQMVTDYLVTRGRPSSPERTTSASSKQKNYKDPNAHIVEGIGEPFAVTEPQEMGVGASVMPSWARPSAMPSQLQGHVVDVPSLRESLETPRRRQGDAAGAREDGGRCGHHDRSPRASLPEVPPSSSRTTCPRTSSSGDRLAGQGEGVNEDDEPNECRWVSSFFHRAYHPESQTRSHWVTAHTASEDSTTRFCENEAEIHEIYTDDDTIDEDMAIVIPLPVKDEARSS